MYRVQTSDQVSSMGQSRQTRRGQARRLRKPLKVRQAIIRWATALLLAGGLIWRAVVPIAAMAPIFEDPDVVTPPVFPGLAVALTAPAFADIDNDGDLDAFIGEDDNELHYYRNDGSANEPNFVKVTGSNHPFDGLTLDYRSAPTFVDIDGDGDLDAFMGTYSGTINYYRNIGNAGNPVFVMISGSSNPLSSVNMGSYSTLDFVDVDSDNDLDAFIGGHAGTIDFYRNDSSGSTLVFTWVTGSGNPLDGVNVGNDSAPAFVDIDGDGDSDAFIGGYSGTVQFFRNDGNTFSPIVGSGHPLDEEDVSNYNVPAFADIDGDGDMDVFMGSLEDIYYYYNAGEPTAPEFVCGDDNPLKGVDTDGYAYSFPALADLDGDGDLDAFVGGRTGDATNFVGSMSYYRNDGDAANPHFVRRTGGADPFDDLETGVDSKPTFVDINNDGDLDAFVGTLSGAIDYYRNDGDANNPNFVAVIGDDNPMPDLIGTMRSVDFVDIDNDGDFDAFFGVFEGTIDYYRNDGDAGNPNFVEASGTENPLASVDVGTASVPTFADVDDDGDFDCVIGAQDGTFRFYRNDGDPEGPVFVEVTGASNPFDGLDVGYLNTSELVDIDADGDIDVFAGETDGAVYYYQNYGITHKTQEVIGSQNVRFGWGINRVDLNAGNEGHGTDLGETEVYIEAQAQATSVDDEALRHRYYITPSTTSGLNASIVFYFGADELPTGQDCNTLNVYHWNGTAWDAEITPTSRQCSSEPYSLTITAVSNFSPFVLRSGGEPSPVALLSLMGQVPSTPALVIGLMLTCVVIGGSWRKRR